MSDENPAGRPVIDARERVAAMDLPDERPEVVALLANIHRDLDTLDRLAGVRAEEAVYRFYHQSFKAYQIQATTRLLVEALVAVHPRSPATFHGWFATIIDGGLGKTFDYSDNEHWTETTRPLLEAFFHARYFVEQASKYGHVLDVPPSTLPYGWAALLELYGLRYDLPNPGD